MSKKILKNLVVFAMLSLLALPIVTMAQNIDVGINEIEEGFGDNGLGNVDPRTTIARLINVAMLFLGI
ncbi:MAG TPA: hypothetical protein PKH52_01905, partial [bacterium]|nr:hypothetical protein [bacterium]